MQKLSSTLSNKKKSKNKNHRPIFARIHIIDIFYTSFQFPSSRSSSIENW
jgi:hypothetical protein